MPAGQSEARCEAPTAWRFNRWAAKPIISRRKLASGVEDCWFDNYTGFLERPDPNKGPTTLILSEAAQQCGFVRRKKGRGRAELVLGAAPVHGFGVDAKIIIEAHRTRDQAARMRQIEVQLRSSESGSDLRLSRRARNEAPGGWRKGIDVSQEH